MACLPDTNVCVTFLRHPDSPVAARLIETKPEEIFLCYIVLAELFYGAYRSRRVAQNLEQVRQFGALFEVLSFETRAAEHYGKIRRELEQAGTIIGSNDLLIASIALAHDLTLVTHNVREFWRVTGLRVEDWETK